MNVILTPSLRASTRSGFYNSVFTGTFHNSILQQGSSEAGWAVSSLQHT